MGSKAIAAISAAVLMSGGLVAALGSGSTAFACSGQVATIQAVPSVLAASGLRNAQESGSSAVSTLSTGANLKAHKWTYAKAPNYYKVRGKAKTTKIAAGKIKLSKWDSLGRTRTAVAKVTYKMVEQSAGSRYEYDSDVDTISGWGHQKIVQIKLSNGRTYRGYAFNRSHLIADSLGGPASKENMITGTRTQNVGNNTSNNPGGMAYTETLARNYLYRHHNGWVYYRVTPVYKGAELVARSVYVDIKSDDGSINKRVEVFNAMNGYTLNYKTGAISKGKTSSVSTSTKSSSSKRKTTSSSSSSSKYVYITNTGNRYHAAGCRWLYASKIKVTLSQAKSRGLTPCQACNP